MKAITLDEFVAHLRSTAPAVDLDDFVEVMRREHPIRAALVSTSADWAGELDAFRRIHHLARFLDEHPEAIVPPYDGEVEIAVSPDLFDIIAGTQDPVPMKREEP